MEKMPTCMSFRRWLLSLLFQLPEFFAASDCGVIKKQLFKQKTFVGGTIISEQWFLTSAHCFNEEIYSDLNNIVAYVGEHDLSTSSETMYTESYEIEKFVRHREYWRGNPEQDNDIALVKTIKPIQFSRAVGPACLPWSFSEE